MKKSRKRNRKQNFDYSENNIYFITSCCKERIHHFGEIIENEMHRNEFGEIAHKQMLWLAQEYPYIKLHNFIVMPNHVHILIEIVKDNLNMPSIKLKSLSSLIGAFKTTSSKKIHLAGNKNFYWQRSFHDHIVRNTSTYNKIFSYIKDNPKTWETDTFHTQI